MKLYIKQKVFSWKDKFTVKNEYGEDKYYIEGQLLSLGKKLRVFDTYDRELVFVKQKLVSLLPKFFVEINGEEVAEIVKKLSLFTPKYVVKGPEWDIRGDVFAHDYVISSGKNDIARIHKKWMAWGDTFEIDVMGPENELLALGVVLAIDAVMDAQQNASA
ncbi:MAG: LURP-one-related family protein [Clostridia bacterium]|nr:LURP-one-related family protein [Clostridia bacterium]